MQLDSTDDVDSPTIEAFKELSLQRDRRAEIRGGRGMAGGKAQGLRGLATGGRAGMAKRNLAGLAPDFVKDSKASSSSASTAPAKPTSKLSALAARSSAKRPAENPPPSRPRPASPAPSPSSGAAAPAPSSVPATSASRPQSKLAALAAARSSASASASSSKPAPATSHSQEPISTPVEAPAKPLSKLQQRMLANKQQRAAATPEAKEAAAAEAAEEELRSRPQTCFGSDLPISSLFPTADSGAEISSAPTAKGSSHATLSSVSAIAGSGQDATDQLVAPLSKLRMVPGGSPFALYVQGATETESPQIEMVKKAFAGPSPDDVVENARAGTRLGAR